MSPCLVLLWDWDCRVDLAWVVRNSELAAAEEAEEAQNKPAAVVVENLKLIEVGKIAAGDKEAAAVDLKFSI